MFVGYHHKYEREKRQIILLNKKMDILLILMYTYGILPTLISILSNISAKRFFFPLQKLCLNILSYIVRVTVVFNVIVRADLLLQAIARGLITHFEINLMFIILK